MAWSTYAPPVEWGASWAEESIHRWCVRVGQYVCCSVNFGYNCCIVVYTYNTLHYPVVLTTSAEYGIVTLED